jgi:hypothetical protein
MVSIDATLTNCITVVLLAGIYRYSGCINPSINAAANKYLFHGTLKTSFLLEKEIAHCQAGYAKT